MNPTRGVEDLPLSLPLPTRVPSPRQVVVYRGSDEWKGRDGGGGRFSPVVSVFSLPVAVGLLGSPSRRRGLPTPMPPHSRHGPSPRSSRRPALLHRVVGKGGVEVVESAPTRGVVVGACLGRSGVGLNVLVHSTTLMKTRTRYGPNTTNNVVVTLVLRKIREEQRNSK